MAQSVLTLNDLNKFDIKKALNVLKKLNPYDHTQGAVSRDGLVILEKKESSKFLFNAIEKLNYDQKTAYILKNIQGMPYSKISQIMEKSVSSIESLIFRAKKNLKTELEKKLNNKK